MKRYKKPETEIALLTAVAVMQGIVVVSGQNGPVVNPDPIDPIEGEELVNTFFMWEDEEDEEDEE